jgi:hypothetical protein
MDIPLYKMKTQSISRKNLLELYKTVYDGWKLKIAELLASEGKDIIVENTMILDAYNQANNNQKKLLSKYFKIEIPKPITDRIKNFNDILKISGKKLEEILPWKNPKNKNQISQNALAKIQLITEVYNEGWIPDFTNLNQYKYYIWRVRKKTGWVLFGVAGAGVYAEGPAGSFFKTRELGQDAWDKFSNIWIEYLPE